MNCFPSLSVMGTFPVLSVSDGEDDQVNVSCTSDGWSPHPALTWTGGEGEMIQAHSTVYTTGSNIST